MKGSTWSDRRARSAVDVRGPWVDPGGLSVERVLERPDRSAGVLWERIFLFPHTKLRLGLRLGPGLGPRLGPGLGLDPGLLCMLSPEPWAISTDISSEVDLCQNTNTSAL